MNTMIRQSILSGALVGIGVVINTVSENRYAGAMLFSLALLTIIHCGLKLYTGKIGFVMTVPAKDLGVMLLGNLFGVLIPTLAIASQKKNVMEKLLEVSGNKFSASFLAMFIFGCFCGVLMFVAVYCKNTVITVFCIMVFILSGFEHCIADFPYLAINFSLANLGKFLCVVAGNSVGSIVTHYLIKDGEVQKPV
ncbi:MAG: formate/nitrite transporter family protein [Dorea sp.]|jgi:formate/nitrite transporter FocA (FNT family)|nr:formate/nitrite transporter family protein [Dorea sp.]